MKKLMISTVASALLLSGTAFAHDDHDGNYSFSSDNCSVDVNYGIVVEKNNIRFVNDDETYVQINNHQQLFVEGKQVALTDRQQALVSEYSEQINQQVPEVVNLAIDAIDIAFHALTQVMNGLNGENSDNHERLEQVFGKIREKVETRFNETDGNYYLAQQDFDEFDQFIEDELEGEIEELVSSSVGNLLIAVGSAMNSEEGGFDQKMEAFGERMERMGEDIEVAVEAKAEKIGLQAEQLCSNLKDLDQLEDELTASIDELAKFNLLTVSAD
ncbi:hypothetical protein A9Q98_07490 [Thalassotalea sp. 42_200_T64]|nr:hypothetical protein A9Q98_07490 [Thalassotalea sp. 42_200_T64]